MTRTELVNAIAEEAGITKVAADKALKAVIESITGCLKNKDSLSLVGFGTFTTSERAARKGKNPRTGKQIDIPASVAPRFKAGKALKDAVSK